MLKEALLIMVGLLFFTKAVICSDEDCSGVSVLGFISEGRGRAFD